MKQRICCATGLICSLLFAWNGCGNSTGGDDADASDVPSDTGSHTRERDTVAPYSFDVDVGDSQIPYIVIDTYDETILNEPKIPAEMRIYVEKSLVQINDIGIEYRGSSSYRMSEKKSFGIETWDADGNDEDEAFFGFPKEEDWILVGHIVNADTGDLFDRTLMYHHLAYRLYRDMSRYGSRIRGSVRISMWKRISFTSIPKPRRSPTDKKPTYRSMLMILNHRSSKMISQATRGPIPTTSTWTALWTTSLSTSCVAT